jgi:hypothetical protein
MEASFEMMYVFLSIQQTMCEENSTMMASSYVHAMIEVEL